MNKIIKFDRCIYCFELKENPKAALGKVPGEVSGACRFCGYEDGYCSPRAHWLSPGTILKGRYMVGKLLKEKKDELVYLGWDFAQEYKVEIHEYYPSEMLQRDITVSEQANIRAGFEEKMEIGKQEFFDKAKLFYKCTSRVEELKMDFFVRNQTCYYVRKHEENR